MSCSIFVMEERSIGTSDVNRATPVWICGKAPITIFTFCSILEIFWITSLTEAAVDFVRSIKSGVRLNWASNVSLVGPPLG